ncbi:MAG: hypothetical protein HYZ44_06975 [Bacteroidetes bacterium]|nr:hypothetical protein [Bacteroidota bacterium]
MKLNNRVFILLLLIACKDGGFVPNSALQNDWVEQYNQQVALNYVSGSSSTVFNYDNGGKQFTVSIPLQGTCASPDSQVEINGIPERFSDVICYSTKLEWFEDPNFYVISTSKRENRKLMILTFSLMGKLPEARTYTIGDYSLDVGYSVYYLNEDGSIDFDNREYYLPMTGSVDLFNTFGRIQLSSNLLMRKLGGAYSFWLVSKLSCCDE